MTTSDPIHLYGSANDLPSFQDMERQIEAFKVLGALLHNFDDSELKSLEEKRNSIVRRVDSFYDLLGHRNWVFTGDLSLKELDSVIASPDAERAEERLITYYQQAKRLEFPVQQLARFDAMRPRLTLIQNALNDYNEGRYYSCVLVLIAMMDGFVSDFDADSNKGLHARPAEGMVAWDSVVGHHFGLSHAHASFTKGFYKTRTEEIHELSRNGIMHGMLVNFDNEVVATKAWNRLFAIADWADAKLRLEVPVEPQPEIEESLRQLALVATEREKMAVWETYSCPPAPESLTECDAGRACGDFRDELEGLG